MTASPYLIGIAAGLVSAVLFTSLSAANILAILLFCLAPLPILLAGFGWGVAAAQAAFLFGALLVPLLKPFNYNLAILFVASVGLPGLILSWLASLRRPSPADGAKNDNPVIEWYPAGRIVIWAAVMAGVLVAAGIWMVGDAERYQQGVKNMFNPNSLPMLKALAGASKDPAQLDRVIELFGRFVLPASLGFTWLLIMLCNIWLAAKSALISGQLARPWPEMLALEYPPVFLVAFLAAIGLGAMLPGQTGIMAMAFVGAFCLAYMVIGLTVIHSAVPNTPLKPIIMAGVYMGLLVVGQIFIPVLILLGLGEPVLQIRRRRFERPTPPDSTAGPNS